MSDLREEIAAADAHRDRLVAKANAAERDGDQALANHYDSLYEKAVTEMMRLRAELDEEESRGGFDRIARRLNLSEW